MVLAALERAGLPLDVVRLVFLLPADAKAAWSSGAVDAWATWKPCVSQEEVLGTAPGGRRRRGLEASALPDAFFYSASTSKG